MKRKLTLELLKETAIKFCETESSIKNKDLFGVTDGKAIGTYIEHKFHKYLQEQYEFERGSSAKGIDLPGNDIRTDIKVTSINQPQSSCPFENATQKIFGLGYNILLFVYDKKDNHYERVTKLDFVNCSFLEKERTSDYTTTFRIREMLNDGANRDDIISYLKDRNLPADEITLEKIADLVFTQKPELGYLTISNALQWRLQYSRIINLKENIKGISKLVK